MENQILKIFDEAIALKKESKKLSGVIEKSAKTIIKCLRAGKKVVLFGNGGSAADCQHIAAELVCRFEKERKSFAAIALTTDTSLLTSISNDYNFENVFTRQVEGLVNKGDVVIAISTSGNSANVISAAKQAARQGAVVIGMTGASGGKMKNVCDIIIAVPSNVTARIQEVHITVGHIICKLIENDHAICPRTAGVSTKHRQAAG